MRRATGILLTFALAAASCWAGPAEAVAAAAFDLARQPDADQRHVRYLWHPGPKAEEFEPVLRFQANSLSRKATPEAPALIGRGLWRVDLRHYGWSRTTWEKLADLDPYFHARVVKETFEVKKMARRGPAQRVKRVRLTKELTVHAPWLPALPIHYLSVTTGSDAPIVRADWWFVQSCRQLSLTNKQTGVGYFDWLGLKDRDDFFALARFRVRDSRALEMDRKAVVESKKSGVSEQNRQIDREQALTGGVWTTLDVSDESGRGNAPRNLRRGDYKHAAEEHYLPLPNGLPAYFLCDAQGNRQDSAPDFIGGDHSTLNASNDYRIHDCLACVRCHAGEVLRPIDDWARRSFTVGRLALLVPAGYKDLGKDEQFRLFQELKRQYLSDLKSAIDVDRVSYQRAIIAACGLDAATLAKHYATAFHGYADIPVGPEQAALEWGVTVEELKRKFLAFVVAKGGADSQLLGLLGGTEVVGGLVRIAEGAPPAPIARTHFEELYPLGQRYLAGDLRD